VFASLRRLRWCAPPPRSAVDDGSGILHCNCWFNQNAAYSSPAPVAAGTGLSRGARASLYRRSVSSSRGFVSTPYHMLALGAVVRARGTIKPYMGGHELSVDSLCECSALLIAAEGTRQGAEGDRSAARMLDDETLAILVLTLSA
jgi:hypothetical protein